MDDVEDISKDTALGIDAMSAFTGIQKRKLYHLATTGQLPGAFRLGRGWAMMKSVYAAELRARAARSTNLGASA